MKNIITSFRKKKAIGKLLPIVLPLIMLFALTRCDDMNSIHQQYFDRGEDIYTGVVDSLKAFPGYEKVRFTWEMNADPRITKTVIYWNQRADSVVVNVNRTQSGRLQMTHDILNIDEGSYIFEFITRDNEGHFSLPIESVVQIYGEQQIALLRSRGVSAIYKRSDGRMLIEWAPVSSSSIQYATVYYTTGGVEQSVQVENDEMETNLSGLQTGDKIWITTTHLLDGALETLSTGKHEYVMPEKVEREINKANFSAIVMAGDNNTVTSSNTSRTLDKIWDGGISNPAILHTVENAAGFNFPHHFTFDMGVLAELSRFKVWARTDAGIFSGHSLREFEIWGTYELKAETSDENYWKTDAWKADWTMMGDCETAKPSTQEEQELVWKTTGWEYSIDDTVGQVRYIRLVIKSNWGTVNCVNIGEITLWGNDL